jgi:hypothetical protein
LPIGKRSSEGAVGKWERDKIEKRICLSLSAEYFR